MAALFTLPTFRVCKFSHANGMDASAQTTKEAEPHRHLRIELEHVKLLGIQNSLRIAIPRLSLQTLFTAPRLTVLTIVPTRRIPSTNFEYSASGLRKYCMTIRSGPRHDADCNEMLADSSVSK
jgi:hypothetical protein